MRLPRHVRDRVLGWLPADLTLHSHLRVHGENENPYFVIVMLEAEVPSSGDCQR